MTFRCPPPIDKPIEALPVDGEVVLMGDMVAVSMTPQAALESADRIRQAAEQALEEQDRRGLA